MTYSATSLDPRPSIPERIVDRFTYPADHPFTALTGYYLLLLAVGAALLYFIPALRQVVSGERLAEMIAGGAQNSLSFQSGTSPSMTFGWMFAVYMLVSMLGSFALMLPTSWVYMATRQKKGFDQTMVQTLIILAMAVTGVVVIVRNSLALAFSLAGIVGAVRFRNSLPDTRDTLYVFLAIGVGLASGVEALGAAAVLSVVFNYTVLLLNRSDYGMCELGKSSRPLLLTHPGTTPSSRERNGKKPDFNGVIVVRTRKASETMRRLPAFLDQELKRWTLAEVESSNRKGRSHLKYLVRLRKETSPEQLEDAILEIGGEDIIGVKVH
jgi:hypothetical protein